MNLKELNLDELLQVNGGIFEQNCGGGGGGAPALRSYIRYKSYSKKGDEKRKARKRRHRVRGYGGYTPE